MYILYTIMSNNKKQATSRKFPSEKVAWLYTVKHNWQKIEFHKEKKFNENSWTLDQF